MTIEEKIKDMLIQNGMFDNQADEVMQLVKKVRAMESMQGRWNDSICGYPEQALAVVWIAVKMIALEWIESNAPKVWYKPMFMN